MTREDDDEDDDLLPELPSMGERGDEEPAGPDDLGTGEVLPEEDERVGLDDSAGVDGDDALFALDLPPKEKVVDEDDMDVIPIDGLDGDDEYGWTDANEGEAEGWDDELDLGKESTTSEDAGEEGVDDVFEIGGGGDDDASHLPALRGHDPEDDAEELDGLVAVTAFDDEPRMVSAAMLPRLACEVSKIADGPVCCVDGVYIGGQGVRTIDGAESIARDHSVTSLAAFDGVIVIVSGGGLRAVGGELTSCDPEGRSLAWVGRDGERLWGAADGGAVFTSEDRGAGWSGPLLLAPAVAMAIANEGGVVVLCAGRDAPAQVARSTDGKRWTAAAGPSLGEGVRRIDTCGDSIAIACSEDPRGPSLSNDRGKTWSRVPGLPRTGAIALVREAGGLTLYAAHDGFVARHRPGGGEPALVLEHAIEQNRVHTLRAERRGDSTILLVGSDAGLHRVQIDPELA
jgi:hypothetical protein